MENTQTWQTLLQEEKKQPYFRSILTFITRERTSGKTIYPQNKNIFNAFKYTPFDQVRVVILGQDPYARPNQAHGLCFSVTQGTTIPPSLKNIFQELHDDLGIPIAKQGCLEKWAHQGVFLLNTVLTVEAYKPLSHSNIGWETFTDHVIALLNTHKKGLIFLLWGAFAQNKGRVIDRTRHRVLETTHPSPLSAYRGFLGCNHFSQTNALLKAMGQTEIDWCV